MFKKAIGNIHLWLGLLSGLVVFVLGITGALMAFEDELKDVFYSKRIFVDEQKAKSQPFDTLINIAQTVFGKSKPISRIQIMPGSKRTYIFMAYGDADSIKHTAAYSDIVYINPYTGKVQYTDSEEWEFFSVVLSLHYDLMLHETGEFIVRWSTVIFVVMLITGLILWFPKTKNRRKQSFWFKWKKTTRWKRKNYDLHNIPGFYILIIALFISLSGLMMGFQWFSKNITTIANGGKEQAEEKEPYSNTTIIKRLINFKDVLFAIQQQQPTIQKFLIVMPSTKEGIISVRCYLNPANYTKQNTLYFDQYTGSLLSNRPYKSLSNGDKASMANYDIHVGKILGVPGQILAFFASLIAASLPVTGALIWWGKRKKNLKVSTKL